MTAGTSPKLPASSACCSACSEGCCRRRHFSLGCRSTAVRLGNLCFTGFPPLAAYFHGAADAPCACAAAAPSVQITWAAFPGSLGHSVRKISLGKSLLFSPCTRTPPPPHPPWACLSHFKKKKKGGRKKSFEGLDLRCELT